MRRFITLIVILSTSVLLFACNEGELDSTVHTSTSNETDVCDKGNKQYENTLVEQIEGDTIAEKVENYLSLMTLEQKAAQMVQAERANITPAEVKRYGIGSILSGGGSVPSVNTPEEWAKMYNDFQEKALESETGIPIIYGVDAVHGHNNVRGATVFPHNIGLGAANDPYLMYRIGETTAEEVAITGLDWNFSPAVSVVQDKRWGRFYEGFGETPELQVSLVKSYIQGLQQYDIVATAKHFIGDGGTSWNMNGGGTDWPFVNPDAYKLDRQNTELTMEELRQVHLPGYIEAIDAGVDTIMISYNSYNGQKMHGSNLTQTVLKDELGFKGFIISDWEAIHELEGSLYNQVIKSINSGVDMLMEPVMWKETINHIVDAVENGDLDETRVDDAVRRILTVKYKRNLFTEPLVDYDGTNFNSESHKELAREAARKSQVLLKNEGNVLPLSKDTNILLLGPGANNIGLQMGGWSLEWQGTNNANLDLGTSIYEGFNDVVSQNGGHVYQDVTDAFNADVAVVVLSEIPYAEGIGDNGDLTLSSVTSHIDNITALNQAKQTGLPVVVILMSGRPLLVTDQISDWDAFVAAWLPGSEGGSGISDVIFDNEYDFSAKLPITWPKDVTQFDHTANMDGYNEEEYLFPYGFGLSYE